MFPFDEFIKTLQEQLLQTLPGHEAHLSMMPQIRKNNFHIELPNISTRKGAVLILLYPNNKSINTVLIHRNTYKGIHSDQMAFPGGKYEKNDESLSTTALREANEEVGIAINEVNIIGALSQIYIPPSNFSVQPFIAFTTHKPQFVPQAREVKKIVEIDILDFFNSKNIIKTDITVDESIIYEVPCWNIDNHIIWGATAMILSEFCEVIKPMVKY